MQLGTRNSIRLVLAGQPWTVQLAHASNRVISSAGADWSEVTLQSYFGLDAAGAPIYNSIVDIQKPAAATSSGYPAAANSASGKWEIFLAVNYAGADNAAAGYFIQKDFQTVSISGVGYAVPVPAPGDTQTVPLWQRSTAQLIAAICALEQRPARGFNRDQSKFFELVITGAPGNEVVGVATTGTLT